MKICQPNDIKLFCKDYVEKAEYMFVFATSATVLIILSLVSYALKILRALFNEAIPLEGPLIDQSQFMWSQKLISKRPHI